MHSMIISVVVAAGFATSVSAFVPSELVNRAVTTCTSKYGNGICANTATNCAGVYLPGYCPGPNNIQCCITTPIKCETPDGNGLCGDTDRVCGNGNGFYSAGYCPGPNDVQCCVPTPADPPPSDDDGDNGANTSDDVAVDTNIMADKDVIDDLVEEGLDGDFDDDGNPIITRDLARLDERAAAAKTKGQLIYAAAAKQLGVPYKWAGGNCAGKTNGGFDCSGLVLHAVCKVTHKVLPHKASAQYTSAKGRKVKFSAKQQGDAIFWGCGTSKGIYHVGIVKNSTHFINAPHSGAKVRVQKYWGTPCKSAVRFW